MASRLWRSRRLRVSAVLLAAGVCGAIAWITWSAPSIPGSQPPPVVLERKALELRADHRLYAPGSSAAFQGLLVENFTQDERKLEIEIHDGKAHGQSRGWFENGQIEVEETFVRGVSNGRRTRWYASGQKRSETEIVDGVLEGSYREWHENGKRAVEMTMDDGVPHGIASSWSPSGVLESKTTYQAGKITNRESIPGP